MAWQRVRHNQVTFTFTSLFNHSISSQQSASIGSSSQVSISNKGQMTFAHVSLEGKIELREHRFFVFFFFFFLYWTASISSCYSRQSYYFCTSEDNIFIQLNIYIYMKVKVSVTQLCAILCNSMHCSTPGFPVLHCLPEFGKTHVHWVRDAIKSSHPLSSPSPPALNLSQHHSLFQWVSSLQQMAKVLELQFQHQSFQRIFRVDVL